MKDSARFELKEGYHLSSIREGDQAAYIQHFSDEALTDALLHIPFPYTSHDADAWIKARLESASQDKPESQFAIRRPDGFLIGGCCLVLSKGINRHRGEIGYWITTEYRGRGYVRAAVQALIFHGFAKLGLSRIEATVDRLNRTSQHILEKTGFAREGLLQGYHEKNGVLIDCYMYGLLAYQIPPRDGRDLKCGDAGPPLSIER